jgi:CubicO group peptidase (beta-lactamase class C family)
LFLACGAGTAFGSQQPDVHAPRDAAAGRGVPAGPLSDEDIALALGEYVESLVAADHFSGAVLLARGETPIFRQAWGQASKRFDVPNRVDTKFNLGSMNKMFTGVAIAQLVEAGKLSFDDKVGKHLPDYPDAEVAEKVTLHHLLTHTSGLGSYWNERWDANWTTLREVADMLPIFAGDPLAFEPGTRFEYSNVGPVVLGLVIEAVSGQSYYDYVREHIYAPCEMRNSDCFEMDLPIPNLAIGYTQLGPDHRPTDGTWRNNLFLHSIRGGPAGGGFSTVDDLLRFSIALQRQELLSVEMTEILLTGRAEMGPGMDYAYLFGVGGSGAHRSYGHNGGAPGISADFAFYPELEITLVVLSNYDGEADSVSAFARELIER